MKAMVLRRHVDGRTYDLAYDNGNRESNVAYSKERIREPQGTVGIL
jgi:hypothetical protein